MAGKKLDEKMLSEPDEKRDYFWVVIILGIALVTVGALYAGSYLAKTFLNRDTTTQAGDAPRELKSVSDIKIEEKKDADARIDRLEGAMPAPVDEKTKAEAQDLKRQYKEAEEAKEAEKEAKEKAAQEKAARVEANKKAALTDDIVIEKKSETVRPASVSIPKEEKIESPVVAEKESSVAVEKTEAPKAAAPEEKEAAPASDDGVIYVLQLGNFKDEENAKRFKQKVEGEIGLEVYVARIDHDGGTKYRVQVGAFRDKKNAQKLGRELQVLGFNYYVNAQK